MYSFMLIVFAIFIREEPFYMQVITNKTSGFWNMLILQEAAVR